MKEKLLALLFYSQTVLSQSAKQYIPKDGPLIITDRGQIQLEFTSDIESVTGKPTGPFMPQISGKWIFKDTDAGNTWSDTTSIRLCMEMGLESDYESHLESTRFYRLGKEGEYWNIQSLLETQLPGPRRIYGTHCQKSINDAVFDNSGQNGIQMGPSTIDYDNKELTAQWSRPFDVSADGSLTLDTTSKYYIWLTWVITDSHETVVRGSWGAFQEADRQIMELYPPPDEPTISSSAVKMSSSLIGLISSIYFMN